MHDYHPRLVDPSFNATPVSVMKEHNVNDSSTRMNNPQPTHSCSQGHWEQQDRFLDTSVSPELDDRLTTSVYGKSTHKHTEHLLPL